MNGKNSVTALLFLLIPLFSFSQRISQSLGKIVSDFDVITIDANRILSDLDSKEFDGNIDLFLSKGLNFSLELFDSKLLNEDYFAVNTEGKRAESRTIFTLQGLVKNVNGSRVRLTVAEDFIYGFIDEGNGDIWYIEPANYYDNNFNENWYVVYNQKDVKMISEGWCAASETISRKNKFEKQFDAGRQPGSCFEVELAIASDFSMYQKYGNTIPGVENHNIGVMNNVQGNYDDEFADELLFVIVEQFISTCSTCDPWTNSTNAGTLLASFRNWGPTGFSNTHDVGQMWTNRDFDGSTVGIAYVGVVCNSFRYHCLSDFTNNAGWLRVMTAHEIGHNFNAVHDPGGSNTIMAPVVSSATQWSAASITDIENHYLSRTCLATCPPPAPPAPEFYANYTNICEGSMIQFVDESANSPTSWTWTFPGGIPSSSSAQNPTVTYNNPGTYNVTLNATNGNGSTQITKNGYITVGSGGTEILFYDNFESGLGNWTVDNPDGGATWTSANVGGSIAGNNVAQIDNYNYFGGNGEEDALISPVFDLTGRANAQLHIQYAYTRYNGNTTDSLNVWVSLNGGASFTQLVYNTAENGSGNFATVPDQTAPFTPVNPSDWCYASTYNNSGCISIDLSGFFNENNLVFKIENVSDYGNNLFVDNVTFTSDCQIIAPPVADFNSDIQSGCVPFAVQFFDQSQNSPDTWTWTFPGGTPSSSTMQNPVILYSTEGNFDVSLTTSNFAGSSNITKSFYITALDVPDPSFLSDVNGNIVIFTNTTTGASSYLWDFDDGNTSTLQDPVHNYSQDGEYTVTLTAFNSCGSEEVSEVIVIVTPPVANFSSDVNSGCAPLTVQFTDESSANASAWLWSFPGGTPSSSDLENPQIVYNVPGTYDVSLQVSNAAGSNMIIQTDFITVNDIPTANYSYAITDQVVDYSNSSTNADSYEWNFGDGTSSSLSNPSHDYGMDGTFTVQLIAMNECGNDTLEQIVVISTLPVAGGNANVTEGCAPLVVQFTDQSSNNVDTWLWIFEGGNPASSNLANPVVTYENPGVFDVILEVSNGNGSDIINLMNYITVSDIPASSFSSSQDQLDVDFQNSSSNADSYLWIFGDGTTSSQTDPSHTYPEDGVYIVSLIATNECGNDTADFVLNLLSSTVAGATADNTDGCVPFVVQFTDQSSANVTNWSWTFEGGNPTTSSLQNPLVQYNTTGSFNVQLIVSNNNFSDTLVLVDYINVNDIPISSFTQNQNDLNVAFQNTSVNADSYFWFFGDGNTSTLENPFHTYNQDGSYSVDLVATNECGSDTLSTTIVLVSPPEAGAFANSTNGCIPMTVQFNDQSSANVTNWNWTFEGGNPASSTLQNPEVLYATPGTFDVQLIVSNAGYSDTLLLIDYITVGEGPASMYSSTANDLQVQFTNSSTNATSYIWTFGDGNSSSASDPMHVYDEDGTYAVTLISTNACGSDTLVQIVNVVSPPTANFNANVNAGCLPLVVQFNNQSSANVTNWLWTFQGGNPAVSGLPNPLVTYNSPGNFNVQLIVSNSEYSDTILFEQFIAVNNIPNAGFQVNTNGANVNFNNNSTNADSYQWFFGDGNVSSEEDPSYTYAEEGSYQVSLIATNECGSDTVTQQINASSLPTANFQANTSFACLPAEIQFTNLSSPNAESFEWMFEGGNPASSMLENPMVSYANAGVYDVQMIAHSLTGSDTLFLSDYIVIGDVPVASCDFTVDANQALFENLSTAGDSYFWDFGNNTFSSEVNPTATYANDGSYLVELISFNSCGQDTFQTTVTITAYPNAGFSSNVSEGCAPLQVQFTDASTDNVTAWNWEFQGGIPATSNEQNPIVSYEEPGSYKVSLFVQNGVGGNTLSLLDYILIGESPLADFDFAIQESLVSFSNTSLDALDYFWDFGDGKTSMDMNPEHIYFESGSYDVILIASNEFCDDTITQEVQVVVSDIEEVNFIKDLLIAPNPASHQVFINVDAIQATKIELEVWDILGQRLHVSLWDLTTGNNVREIDVSSYPSGSYFISLREKDGFVVRKMIVE